MRGIGQCVLSLGLLFISTRMGHAAPYGDGTPAEYFTCGYSHFSGSFTSKRATYSFAGTCVHTPSEKQVPWTAQGAYDETSGQTQEKVVLSGLSPYRGEFQLSMICARGASSSDPWLTNQKCANVRISAQGEFATQKSLLDEIYGRAQRAGGPATASFPYDRNTLLAKRDADLKAEAAALAKAERRAGQLQQAAAISPMILSPVVGQRFPSGTVVPIKLGLPKNMSVGGYFVRIERKDSTGKWVAHTVLPVGSVVAASAAGYTGFGAGTPPCCAATPGKWRISAQVSKPKESRWSDWVEFVVLAPLAPDPQKPVSPKVTQPPTRAFGN